MNICIVSPVFPPEPIVSAQTSAQVAEALLKQNHIVHMITAFPNRPEGELYPGYHRKVYAKSILSERHSIVRCFSTFSQNSSISSRFLENISFGITSGLALLFSKKPDMIFANTWPIFAAGLIRLVASLRKIPLVISIQDVYPESLLTQGRLKKDGLFYKFLVGIDRWIAKGCHTIIPISERFAKIYREERGVSPDRIKVVPNWVDKKAVNPGSKTGYRKQKGISEDAFVLVYGGNIGMAALEAMACGLPVVISDQVGLVDLVRKENVGLVTPLDADQISEAWITLLNDAPLRQQMGSRAKHVARQQFAPSVVAGEMLQTFNGVLAQRSS